MPRFEPLPDRRPAIVAGASSGIGAATATELAAHGFPVALGARRVDKCQELVDEIRSSGGEAVALPLDVTDAESVKGFVHRATEELGDIELLVAGAGDTYFGRLHEISTDTFESQIQIHLIGANRLATAVLPGMVERQRGDLIFVGSDVALRQRPHMGAYGAAKAALARDGDQPADGTRGHGRARVDRASRPDEDRDGLEPVRRCDRARVGGLGQVGPGPPRLLPAAPGISRGPSRSSPRRRAAVSSPVWNSNRRRHLPTRPRNANNSS